MPHISRRTFTNLLGTAALLSVAPRPSAASAITSRRIRLSANENPYGPSPAAVQAMKDAFSVAARYPDGHMDVLTETIARLHGVSTSQVLLGDGSSEMLKVATSAFSGPQRAVVVADPTFEAVLFHARSQNTEVRKVALDASFAHDLAKMRDATNGAGLVYICNPNNPTATITPNGALRAFIASMPQDTYVLVDEAYHHYATSPQYSTVIDLVAKQPNLVVTRTFSKIYAMAGVRCGYAIAQPATIKRMEAQQAFDSMNVFALVAADASLRDAQHVVEHRRRNTETRQWLRDNVERLGYRMLPSEANFVMIDMSREVKPLIASMRANGVSVGRLFPAMPKHMRVTIGTPAEMQRFVEELARV
ncbi:MAG TPA: histidinol-phosphate transaminase [Thermoanaerobaculia bacterium]|nr:histidinol-phosphate transaminase [Thermoanaerobaculia bacterium]